MKFRSSFCSLVMFGLVGVTSSCASHEPVTATHLAAASGSEEVGPRSSRHVTDIARAFDRLIAWGPQGLGDSENDLTSFGAGGPSASSRDEAALLDAGDGGYIFVCHPFWTVVIAALDSQFNVHDVQSFQGKCGFSVGWYAGLVVTCHEHPGTGMFRDVRRHVAVESGGLVITATEDNPDQPDSPPEPLDDSPNPSR